MKTKPKITRNADGTNKSRMRACATLDQSDQRHLLIQSREQVVLSGEHIPVSTALLKEAEYNFPVYITKSVWEKHVQGMEKDLRLWDILWMMRFPEDRNGALYSFSLNINGDLVVLRTCWGPIDATNQNPCLTVMLLTEGNPPETTNKFPLGRTVITRNAKDHLKTVIIDEALKRHQRGDWGDVMDSRENEMALAEGDTLRSVYHADNGLKFWIITEWDRSYTTILMPEDY